MSTARLAHDLRATAALTDSLVRRLLREGMALRSLVWPTGLAAGTLLLTLVVAAALRVGAVVAVSADVDAALAEDIAAEGWEVRTLPDAAAVERAVHEGRAWAGTDGRALWIRTPSRDALQLESLLRAHRGARWRPVARSALPTTVDTAAFGSRIVRIILLLFALYGVIFGLGMVARDRDDGTLEAELSLPVARWVPGAARWLAGTGVLAVFAAYAVALFASLVGVDRPLALFLDGFAACAGAVSLGIGLVGGAGIKQGFSGPLAFGLTGATGLIGLGAMYPELGRWCPLASLMAGGDGVVPAALAVVAGAAAAWLFARRSARA